MATALGSFTDHGRTRAHHHDQVFRRGGGPHILSRLSNMVIDDKARAVVRVSKYSLPSMLTIRQYQYIHRTEVEELRRRPPTQTGLDPATFATYTPVNTYVGHAARIDIGRRARGPRGFLRTYERRAIRGRFVPSYRSCKSEPPTSVYLPPPSAVFLFARAPPLRPRRIVDRRASEFAARI